MDTLNKYVFTRMTPDNAKKDTIDVYKQDVRSTITDTIYQIPLTAIANESNGWIVGLSNDSTEPPIPTLHVEEWSKTFKGGCKARIAYKDQNNSIHYAYPAELTSVTAYVKPEGWTQPNYYCELSVETLVPVQQLSLKGCRNIQSIIIPDEVSSIGSFQNCRELEYLSFQARTTIEELQASAFFNTALKELTLPDSLTSIGKGAFPPESTPNVILHMSYKTYCKFREQLDNAYGTSYFNHDIRFQTDDNVIAQRPVQNNENYAIRSLDIPVKTILSIGDCAFAGYKNLSAITLPSTLLSVGYTLLSGCDNLLSCYIYDNGSHSVDEGVERIAIPDGMFYKCGSLISVMLPRNTEQIGGHAFYECSSLQSITLPYCKTGLKFKGALNVFEAGHSSYHFAKSGLSSIQFYPKDDISEAKGICRECSNLQQLILPSECSVIPESAFMSCQLTSIQLPDTVEKIQPYAFEHGFNNENSYTLRIPEKCVGIGDYAFKDVSATNLVCASSLISIGDYAFYQSSQTNSIASQIKTQNTNIGTAAFANTAIKSFDILRTGEDATHTIGTSAFANCNSMVSAGIQTLTAQHCNISIGDWAFAGCTELSRADFGKQSVNVNYIGQHAFDGCSKLTAYSIGNKTKTTSDIEKIPDYCFNKCSKFSTIAFESNPEKITQIGKSAFAGIGGTKDFNVKQLTALTNIDVSAFSECPTLTSFTFSAPGLTSIGNYAFANCANLKQITLGSGIKNTQIAKIQNLGKYPFSGCPALTGIVNATLSDLSAEYDAAMLGLDGLTTGMTLSSQLFYNASNLTGALTVNIQKAQASCFNGCNNLTSINCGNLTTLTASTYMFQNCTNLQKVILSNMTKPGANLNAKGLFNGIAGTSSSDKKQLSVIVNSNATQPTAAEQTKWTNASTGWLCRNTKVHIIKNGNPPTDVLTTVEFN